MSEPFTPAVYVNVYVPAVTAVRYAPSSVRLYVVVPTVSPDPSDATSPEPIAADPFDNNSSCVSKSIVRNRISPTFSRAG